MPTIIHNYQVCTRTKRGAPQKSIQGVDTPLRPHRRLIEHNFDHLTVSIQFHYSPGQLLMKAREGANFFKLAIPPVYLTD
jgi:hypothetical protein